MWPRTLPNKYANIECLIEEGYHEAHLHRYCQQNNGSASWEEEFPVCSRISIGNLLLCFFMLEKNRMIDH